MAGATYAAIKLPRHSIPLGPNHTRLRVDLYIMSKGSWETPLGLVEIDSRLAKRLRYQCDLLKENLLAHREKHALEVQLPFSQYLLDNDLQFFPVIVSTDRYGCLAELDKTLGEVILQEQKPLLLVVSSDLNHFELAEWTSRKDEMAI